MPKNKDEARAEGYKRGLAGKLDDASLIQGWTDDKASRMARNEGWIAGKRKRSQVEAEAARKARAARR